jgi:hypothetical protein
MLFSQIANLSLRDAIRAIANAFDSQPANSNVELIALQTKVNELQAQLNALAIDVNGNPPVAPVEPVPAV